MGGGSVSSSVPSTHRDRARVRNRIISAVTIVGLALIGWALVSRLAEKGQLTAAKWRPFTTGDLWKTYVLPGIVGTLTAAVLSIVLALILSASCWGGQARRWVRSAGRARWSWRSSGPCRC